VFYSVEMFNFDPLDFDIDLEQCSIFDLVLPDLIRKSIA